ncbi:hypothetical protein [Nonomuraea sp. C10]|jgi:hypothetical protein|uniref:hypothetical protein n=1 Tax=Nonomuraea sp. C10 TaxID=2600577 RepID=UPI0011CDB542|nr:hypothetical protein [Nonomuraea sp. C10]TXK41528.1 hypothetical protein FR742_19895 [Nonomuraea sp. C10]
MSGSPDHLGVGCRLAGHAHLSVGQVDEDACDAADGDLSRGVRVRLVPLLAYLARPLDLVPDAVPPGASSVWHQVSPEQTAARLQFLVGWARPPQFGDMPAL